MSGSSDLPLIFADVFKMPAFKKTFAELTVQYWHVIGECGGPNVLRGRCLRKQVWHEWKQKNKTTGGGRGKGVLNVSEHRSAVDNSVTMFG